MHTITFIIASPHPCCRVTRYAGCEDKKGHKLFTVETKPTVEECIKKAEFLQDPPNVQLDKMYGQTLPTSGMKHGLPFRTSMRGESRVEQMQGQQQHFANVGMRSAVADEYILRGMCRSNARIRQRIMWNESQSDDREKMPVWLRGEPLHFDHLLLAQINEKVQQTGASWSPFNNLFQIQDDTGEQFLSDYKKQQDQRNKTVPVDPHNNRCQCNQCAGNPQVLPWKRQQQTLPTNPEQQEIAQLPFAKLPPMIGCDGESDDEDYPTFDNSDGDNVFDDDDGGGVQDYSPQKRKATYDNDDTSDSDDDVHGPPGKVTLACLLPNLLHSNLLLTTSKRLSHDERKMAGVPTMQRPVPPFQQPGMMMYPRHLQQQHAPAPHQFSSGQHFMRSVPPLPQTPYYQQQYGMPMQQQSMHHPPMQQYSMQQPPMQQQPPPTMMPPGWRHPRAPPQFDGFCCKKKEAAVRNAKKGKHPHNSNCPLRLWRKQATQTNKYYYM